MSISKNSEFDPSHGVLIYTDGSASVKQRTGGWAYVILDWDDGIIEGSGGVEDTTIGQMELMGPIMALEYVAENIETDRVLLISDSQYVVMGFMDKRRARNKNVDLWNRLEDASNRIPMVLFEHVRGHQGNYYNEICDRLAVAARKALPCA